VPVIVGTMLEVKLRLPIEVESGSPAGYSSTTFLQEPLRTISTFSQLIEHELNDRLSTYSRTLTSLETLPNEAVDCEVAPDLKFKPMNGIPAPAA
jgi:hypothetical protein